MALVAFVAGCGGGTKTGEAVRSCLASDGSLPDPSTSKDDLDFFAQDAGDLGMELDLGHGQDVTVVVERSEKDARATEFAYGGFSESFGGEIVRHGNVVIAYPKTPTDAERASFDACTT